MSRKGFRMAGVGACGPQKLTAIKTADVGACWIHDDSSRRL